MEVNNGVLTNVLNEDLIILRDNPEKFWKDVRVIGNRAFSQCSNLVEISIPENVNELSANAFNSCSNLNKVNAPGVTIIGNNAFAFCYNLKAVVVSKGISNIGALAFLSCGKDLYMGAKTEIRYKDQQNINGEIVDKYIPVDFSNVEVHKDAFKMSRVKINKENLIEL